MTHEVSTHPWGQVSTARGQYYYIEFKYLTHEVSTHHWGQVSSARGLYYYFKSKYVRPSFYCKRLVLLPWDQVADKMMSVHITEAKFLLLEVSTTTLSPSIWHLKSVHITEAKFLLLEVSTNTLSPSGWHIDVSTHPLGQVSTARGQYYYIESQYLTHVVSTHHWGQGFTARGQYYYIESQFLILWCQYTWMMQSFYC